MRTLLQDIDDFLRVHPEVTPARLGRAALKDTYFVSGLRKGRSPRESTALAVRAWMADYTERKAAHEAASRAARRRLETMMRQLHAEPHSAPADTATPR